MSKSGSTSNKNTLFCSFCGKSQHEVKKLIAGPTVFICDECVELCMDIIKEEVKTSEGKSAKSSIPAPNRAGSGRGEVLRDLQDRRHREAVARGGAVHGPVLAKIWSSKISKINIFFATFLIPFVSNPFYSETV